MPDDGAAILRASTLTEDMAVRPALRGTAALRPGTPRTPTAADCDVGRRIRDYRVALGIASSELARRIGVSNPQIHRYECGLTRVAASRLIDIAAALGVSVEMLTQGRPDAAEEAADPAASPQAELLMQAFQQISRPEQRAALIALARSMAADEA